MKQAAIPELTDISIDALLEVIGLSVFDDIAESLNCDKWVIKFKTTTIFKLLIFSVLEHERLSLRLMSESFSTAVFQALSDEKQDTISYRTIHARLVHAKIGFYEQAYQAVFGHLSQHFTAQQAAHYRVKRYDSTMIATYSHLLSGMRVGNTSRHKTQVKLTTEFVDDFEVRMSFFKDQDHLSEETALSEVILKATRQKNDLIVFDKGLKDRKKFIQFDKAELCFVSRLNENARYEFVSTQTDADTLAKIEHEELIFIQDSLVHLYGSGDTLHKHPFRMIECQLKRDNSKIFFLTNVKALHPNTLPIDPQQEAPLALTPQQVAQIYKSRWDIEVLFRFLKQEMNLKHFVCNETNAIMAMIYTTLIAAMLILMYKNVNKIKSYKIAKVRFFNELQTDIWLDIVENAKNNPNIVKKIKQIVRKI
jgi:hypothetical protein